VVLITHLIKTNNQSFVKQITSVYETEILCHWKLSQPFRFLNFDWYEPENTRLNFQPSLIYGNNIKEFVLTISQVTKPILF
jgi:hypothetical protein